MPRNREKMELTALERLQKVSEEQTDSVNEQIVQVQVLRVEKQGELIELRKWSLRDGGTSS